MEQTEATTTDSSEWKQRSQELVRPVQGRMFAGVAKGIADSFGIAEWIPRVFFVVTAFMGGLGLVLYAACWAFIRSEDESRSIADRFFSEASTSRSWLGIALIVVAGIIVVSNFTFLAGEVVWAAAFLVIGLLLYMGYIPFGRSEGAGDEGPESKEGVQQMTSTNTTQETVADQTDGDSPAGGAVSPPPTPPPTPPQLPPTTPREKSILGRLTIGTMLLGLGVLAFLDNIEALPIDAHPRHYMALAVTILGVGLLVGSIAGRARWLILLGAIMVPTLIFSPAFEYDWNSAAFNREVTPGEFTELEPMYELGVGRIEIDLRDLPWDGEEIVVTTDVGIGSVEIVVPDGVGIVGEAAVDIGLVEGLGRSSSGIGDPRLTWDESGELGTILLDAEVNIGNVQIRR